MKKKIGWLFTVVGLIGLLPALYGILIMGSALFEANDRWSAGKWKELALPFFLLILLAAGLVLWTGNIRYSFGRKAWWGNRTFWKVSGIYNGALVLFVLILAGAFSEPCVLVWALYPALAGVLSFYVNSCEGDPSIETGKEIHL